MSAEVGWDFQIDALDRGELVYLMDQRQTSVAGEFPDQASPAVEDGICAGLALHWMALRYRGRDLRSQTVTAEYPEAHRRHGHFLRVEFASASIRQAAINQNTVAGVVLTGNSFLPRVTAVMDRYSIPVFENGYGFQGKPVSALFLHEEMRRSGPGLYYLGMRRDKGSNPKHPTAGGHALAIENGESYFKLFDANTGCYRFLTRERFMTFFSKFLAETEYPEFCSSSTWIARIGPRLHNYKNEVDRLNRRHSMLQADVGSPFLRDPIHTRMRRPIASSRFGGSVPVPTNRCVLPAS